MASLLVLARILSSTERFVYMPLMMLLGLAMVAYGVHVVRSKRIAARASERLLLGKTEWTGHTAVTKGVLIGLAGAALIIIALVMMILGRTLLPSG